jgi:hypothetical protein
MAHAYNFRDQVKEIAKPVATGPKVLRRMEISPGKNGGHLVTHAFEQSQGPMEGRSHPDEEYIFGSNDGPQLLQHLLKHLKIKAPAPPPTPVASPSANALEQ